MRYSDFDKFQEIGSGCYGMIYTAKYRKYSKQIPESVVLKRFKDFSETAAKLLISEVSSL